MENLERNSIIALITMERNYNRYIDYLRNNREFLEKYPPRYEAQIVENSSWSCCHGVERWRADCGCNSGRAGWNQKWRGPLRAALDFVRDELIKTFDTLGREYFKDPWAARNDYVNLMLDRSLDAQHCFFLAHATEKAWNDRSGALKLLEMQKNALFVWTYRHIRFHPEYCSAMQKTAALNEFRAAAEM